MLQRECWKCRDATQCNTMQHNATHCNTRDTYTYHFIYHSVCAAHLRKVESWGSQTATHCNTLHHTATHCNTLQHLLYKYIHFHLSLCLRHSFAEIGILGESGLWPPGRKSAACPCEGTSIWVGVLCMWVFVWVCVNMCMCSFVCKREGACVYARVCVYVCMCVWESDVHILRNKRRRLCIWMSHVTTYGCVMSRISMSHVTHMDEANRWRPSLLHVTHSCVQHDAFMGATWLCQAAHINESCHTYEWGK